MRLIHVCALLICPFLSHSAALAAEPTARIGDITLYCLEDIVVGGDLDSPESPLVGITPAQKKQAAPDGLVSNQILAYLAKSGGKNLLFDAGIGEDMGGSLLESLEAVGVKPAEIDAVFLTHLHFDHIGGLLDEEGNYAFPNAAVHVSTPEYDWWMDPERQEVDEDAENAEALAIVAMGHYLVETTMETLRDSGKEAVRFDFGEEVFPGIVAMEAVGHTPGHTAYRLRSKNKELWIVGDLMHIAEAQLPFPEVTTIYDIDQDRARETRLRLLAAAAEKGIPIAGMHMPLPGAWRVVAKDEGFAVKPVNSE